jgi:hypothetical protein
MLPESQAPAQPKDGKVKVVQVNLQLVKRFGPD